jgi:pimeloyl-ACP methyl ester carboxylesterase
VSLVNENSEEVLCVRVHGSDQSPTVIYLPGLHGDWTLIPAFRAEISSRARFVEFTYPRTRSWSLDDYAANIIDLLSKYGIKSGWLLGESFGSQILWAIARRNTTPTAAPSLSGDGQAATSFKPLGFILAGGFVRHPVPAAVWCAYQIFKSTPPVGQQVMLWLCRVYGRLRFWNSPQNRDHFDEFLTRRTSQDWAAATHRLRLIVQNDPRPTARQTTLPVYHLAGLIDPIVPGFLIRAWLRSRCASYRGGEILLMADHNVLGTAPRASAQLISDWITRTS